MNVSAKTPFLQLKSERFKRLYCSRREKWLIIILQLKQKALISQRFIAVTNRLKSYIYYKISFKLVKIEYNFKKCLKVRIKNKIGMLFVSTAK
jgi:hypothetical protein